MQSALLMGSLSQDNIICTLITFLTIHHQYMAINRTLCYVTSFAMVIPTAFDNQIIIVTVKFLQSMQVFTQQFIQLCMHVYSDSYTHTAAQIHPLTLLVWYTY